MPSYIFVKLLFAKKNICKTSGLFVFLSTVAKVCHA
jgi:hypothetical protein